MSVVSQPLVELVIAVAVLGVGAAVTMRKTSPRSDFAKLAGQRFAIENQAYIDREFVEQFDGAVRLKSRVTGVAITALIAGTVVLVGRQDLGGKLMLGLLGVLIAVKAVISLVRAGREFRPAPDRLLIARLTATRITDYVHPLYLWACAAATLVSATAAGWAAYNAFGPGQAYVSDLPDGVPAAVVLTSAFIALLAAVTPIHLAALARRPIRAVDSASLYFQDAWRASVMREICFAIAYTGATTGMQGMYDDVPEWAYWAQFGLVCAPVVLCLVADAKGKLWFRARLWSALSPGQVLLPDQPVQDHAQ